jgi:hypothetical protein
MSNNSMTQSVVSVYNSLAATYNAANPGLPQMPTQLWFEQVPESNVPQLPLVVYSHGGEPPGKSAYSTEAIAPTFLDGYFSLTIYGPSIVQVETWALPIMETFVPTSITITNTGNLRLFRTNYQLSSRSPGNEKRDTSGNPVWICKISYHLFYGGPIA